MKETTDELLIAIESETATVTINRPAKRNALNMAVWSAIIEAMLALDADMRVKVILLTGAGGKAFSAGADMSEFTEVYRSVDSTRRYSELVRRAQRTITDLAKPVIAMIDGLCIGGGCGVALACDLRFASERSKFGITPAKIGAAYSFDDTKQLVDLVGPARAKDMLFSGHLLDARTAHAYGLVDRIVPAADLAETVSAYARELCGLSQNSIGVSKRMINAIKDGADEETAELRALFEETFARDDFREGYDAFLNKRKPVFK